MQYRRLGRTDLTVSAICLGTMTWGEQNTEEEAHRQLDAAFEAGVNFVDTAEMYPVPPRAETQGRTETYIGNWLKSRGNRDRVIVATKVSGRANDVAYLGRGETRLDRHHIETAVDASLRRLRTDTIDLYQLHWPDRKTNFFGRLGYTFDSEDVSVPLEETLEALAGLIAAGKVRHVGVSNETPWGLMRFLQLAEANGWPRMASIQNPYNLLNRTFEIGLAEIAIREDCGLLAYSPLGFGVLSGKYLGGARPEGARLTLFSGYGRYANERALRATAAYVEVARKFGLDPAQMALGYVNTRPFVTSNIIGATTPGQLETDLASIELRLDREVVDAIEATHAADPNPCP
jgi:aryl-alcohol dehydrogenase-like predicted oxidoreductase